MEENLFTRDVKDAKVLAAMRKVPRRLFVPEEVRGEAYEDHPLPIGFGQTISQPYIVAFMTELLGLKGGERVLEIGAGSGYQAAVLGEIAGRVCTIEILPELADRAREALKRMGYENVVVRAGNGWDGWAEEAPFDAVIVTAAPREVPPPLLRQLKDGGRLVIPLGESSDQKLFRFTRTGDDFRRETFFPVRFVPFLEEKSP